MTMVSEINETTGELTNQNIGSTGTVLSTNTQRPPAGMSVIYRSTRSAVSSRRATGPTCGQFTVTVVTGAAGSPVHSFPSLLQGHQLRPCPTAQK